MTGCVALRKDVYYVRLTYYDSRQKRKEKWVSTGLSGRSAKQKATAMIQSMIDKYSYLEKSDHPSKMSDYLKMWKELQIGEVAETTYDGYHTYIDHHLIPYFKDLNLNIQDITAGHIFDYANYLSSDGGRKDNKVGGQSTTSIRKIISILRQAFDYAVLYGDIYHFEPLTYRDAFCIFSWLGKGWHLNTWLSAVFHAHAYVVHHFSASDNQKSEACKKL